MAFDGYPAGAQAGKPYGTVYVVQRSWHTGIAIAASDWPSRNWSALRDFPDVEYLELGWGDERFYKAEQNTLWLGSRAALWPTPSTIHVIGLQGPLARTAQADDLLALHITQAGMRRLARSLEQEFAQGQPGAEGSQLASAPAPNRFYPGKRPFFFPRMCNWWIAMHLHAAGCAIQPWSIITSGQVMRTARGFDGETCRAVFPGHADVVSK